MSKEKNFGIKPFKIIGLLFLFWGVNSVIYGMTNFVLLSYLVFENLTHAGHLLSGVSLIVFGYLLFDGHINWKLIVSVIKERNKKELQ